MLLLIGMAILVTRLIWLQAIRGQFYAALSQDEPLPPGHCIETVRGRILDRCGKVLASDQPTFAVCLFYKMTRLYDERYIQARLTEQQRPETQQKTRKELDQQRRQADHLLAILARLCNTPLEEIECRIRQINDHFFLMQTVQARKRYYQSLGVSYPLEPNATAIMADFADKVPYPAERLERIFQRESAVWEMDQPQMVIKNISKDTALTIEDRLIGNWPGDDHTPRWLAITTGKQRLYPYSHLACHLIGQVRKVPDFMVSMTHSSQDPSLEELKGYRRTDRVGEWGIEFLFEDRLKGQRGWIRYDTDRQVVHQIDRLLGQDVTITVDIELQRLIQQYIGGENPQQPHALGAAVVIDILTGQILALVSVPAFDLNSYYQSDICLNINEPDPLERKLNRAIYKNYTPGSTIKPTLLAAAIDAGDVGSHTPYECRAGREGILPSSWCFKTGHGTVDAFDSIKRSCNYFYIDLARQMGAEKVIHALENAGFGQKILAWPDGISGRKQYGSFWETAGILLDNPSPTQLQYICVGVGPINSNVVQIANSVATIARDGVFINPTLVLHPKTHGPSRTLSRNPQTLQLVQKAMQAVIYDMEGTAFKAFQPISWPREQVALFGKTGTTNKECLFAGYAMTNDGKGIALAVVIEEPDGTGGTVAAPIAKQIFDACGLLGYLPAPNLEIQVHQD